MKKSFIIGLATGLTVAGASLVLANSQIQAILNDQIKVTLNGQVQEFKDETTNETQYPITYHDRTYLPLRTVANLVGVDVDYDANTNTAILDNKAHSSYDIFRNNIKEQMTKYSWGVFSTETGQVYGHNFRVILTDKMKLMISFEDDELIKGLDDILITDNVIGFHIAISGPAGQSIVYFINEDGSVGYTDISLLVGAWKNQSGKKELVTKVIKKMDGYKDIVSIIQGSYDSKGNTNEPLFIDVDGNVFSNSYTAWN